MLERLFSKPRKIASQFVVIAEHVSAAARLLQSGFEQPAQWRELSARIEQIQRQADDACHRIHLDIERKYILPVDREDIHLLSTELERVVDAIGGTARRAVSLRAMERREPAVELARTLTRATQHIALAVSHITEAHLVMEQCQAIRRCEEEGDTISVVAVTVLFEGRPDPIDVLRWKTLYDQLEETLGECEEVADELESMSLKHAVL